MQFVLAVCSLTLLCIAPTSLDVQYGSELRIQTYGKAVLIDVISGVLIAVNFEEYCRLGCDHTSVV